MIVKDYLNDLEVLALRTKDKQVLSRSYGVVGEYCLKIGIKKEALKYFEGSFEYAEEGSIERAKSDCLIAYHTEVMDDEERKSRYQRAQQILKKINTVEAVSWIARIEKELQKLNS